MHHRRSKNIFFYFFLFLIIGTFNNKNLNNLEFPKINEINISGLDKKNNYDLQEKLNFLMVNNLFSLNKFEVKEIINIQRYNLTNHLYWLSKGKPGGHKKWEDMNLNSLNNEYKKLLINNNETDTILAVCEL